MILTDLHVHSTYSDGRLTIPQLVDFYGSRGFGCIAITDHVCEKNTLLGLAARYMKFTLTSKTFPQYREEIEREGERAMREYGMLVLPGFELSKNSLAEHRSAHLLGIGVSEFLDPSADVADLARAIRAQGALAIAAHPVPTGKAELQTLHLWNRREELRDLFDAWEVASGAEIFRPVLESGLPVIATSDFHHPANVNAWKTVLYATPTRESVFAAVRNQALHISFYKDLGGASDRSWRNPLVALA